MDSLVRAQLPEAVAGLALAEIAALELFERGSSKAGGSRKLTDVGDVPVTLL